MKLAAVVLAAGASRRLGRPKQLEPVGGEPLLRRAARCALEAGYHPVRVVLGAVPEAARTLDGLRVETCQNEDWTEGMASSIRLGTRDLPPDTEGVLLLVCDQVALEPGVLTRLREAFEACPNRPAACTYQGLPGVPALFPAQALPNLQRLMGDQGARPLLRSGDVNLVPWAEGAQDFDVSPG